jgi:hypothetical protein
MLSRKTNYLFCSFFVNILSFELHRHIFDHSLNNHLIPSKNISKLVRIPGCLYIPCSRDEVFVHLKCDGSKFSIYSTRHHSEARRALVNLPDVLFYMSHDIPSIVNCVHSFLPFSVRSVCPFLSCSVCPFLCLFRLSFSLSVLSVLFSVCSLCPFLCLFPLSFSLSVPSVLFSVSSVCPFLCLFRLSFSLYVLFFFSLCRLCVVSVLFVTFVSSMFCVIFLVFATIHQSCGFGRTNS